MWVKVKDSFLLLWFFGLGVFIMLIVIEERVGGVVFNEDFLEFCYILIKMSMRSRE